MTDAATTGATREAQIAESLAELSAHVDLNKGSMHPGNAIANG